MRRRRKGRARERCMNRDTQNLVHENRVDEKLTNRARPGSSAMKHCPLCHSERIHQSRRKGMLERLVLAMMFVRPFRCERCDNRFFSWSFSDNPNGSREATTY